MSDFTKLGDGLGDTAAMLAKRFAGRTPGWTVEQGAAKGTPMYILPSDLVDVRCDICGGHAGYDEYGRLQFRHRAQAHMPALREAPVATEASLRRALYDDA